MIFKRSFGSSMYGLVRYLLGEGKHNEHESQKVIAGCVEVLEFVGEQDMSLERRGELIAELEAPRVLHPDVGFKDGKYVWHCSFSIGEADGVLSDQVWAEISHKIMGHMGWDREGVSWAAFRHGFSEKGNDHVHLAVCRVDEKGRKLNEHYELNRIHEVCALIEKEYGLTRVDGREVGAVVNASKAELEKAARLGLVETERETLQRKVRAAAESVSNSEGFIDYLGSAGVSVHEHLDNETGVLRGYSFSLNDPAIKDPVRISGSKLGKDLTYPKLVKRWENKTKLDDLEQFGRLPWEQAADNVNRITNSVEGMDLAELSGLAADTAGVYSVLSERLEGAPGPLAAQAKLLSGAAQVKSSVSSSLESVAIVASQAMIHSGRGEIAGWLLLVARLQQLTELIQQNYELRENLHRAEQLSKTNNVLAVATQRELNKQILLQPGVTIVDSEGRHGKIVKTDKNQVTYQTVNGETKKTDTTDLNVVKPLTQKNDKPAHPHSAKDIEQEK